MYFVEWFCVIQRFNRNTYKLFAHFMMKKMHFGQMFIGIVITLKFQQKREC